MFVLRQRPDRRDLLRRLALWAKSSVLVLVAAAPAGAASVLGLPVGKNGLPATWVGEALTVAMAFALPAVLAGLYVGIRRAGQRLGCRGIVLLATILVVAGIGAIAVEQRPELLTEFAAWAGKRL